MGWTVGCSRGCRAGPRGGPRVGSAFRRGGASFQVSAYGQPFWSCRHLFLRQPERDMSQSAGQRVCATPRPVLLVFQQVGKRSAKTPDGEGRRPHPLPLARPMTQRGRIPPTTAACRSWRPRWTCCANMGRPDLRSGGSAVATASRCGTRLATPPRCRSRPPPLSRPDDRTRQPYLAHPSAPIGLQCRRGQLTGPAAGRARGRPRCGRSPWSGTSRPNCPAPSPASPAAPSPRGGLHARDPLRAGWGADRSPAGGAADWRSLIRRWASAAPRRRPPLR
ncbi:hypothetical protein Strvi_9485 (plasmid) [Streptomyces violaceusniger Tu 4113]|uniref:Uncharacterized protein n=1 Tax=Streptomyces violaceusniger (strain Tu 4113) TaxID=653045 RepID=G2PH90_STRV4|nr:hypothetical protein Strvi_9485 [Streptomyces violaceusniger Tu 4113]